MDNFESREMINRDYFDYSSRNKRNIVALHRLKSWKYSARPPFDPSEQYPEMDSTINNIEENEIYESIRQIFHSVGFDNDRFGTPKWNPLKEIAPENGLIVIKPNLVSEPRSAGQDWRCIITHASVIRPVIDYALKAVGDGGEVIVADAPQFDSDFDEIVKTNGLRETLDILRERTGRSIPLIDLRRERVFTEDSIVVRRTSLSGDPKGYSCIDLGQDSLLKEIDRYESRFKGSDYDRSETIYHHSGARHEYLISNSILNSDCVISIPKLKTHKKAGVTLNLKNLVGINGDKNYIPHYRIGLASDGGDEMSESSLRMMMLSRSYEVSQRILPRMGPPGTNLMKILMRLDRGIINRDNKIIRAGDWWGNDTIWRCILDLYRILVFCGRDNQIHKDPQRSLFSMIDGVIAGEGDGPLAPISREECLIIGGRSLLAVDLVSIAAMGHDFSLFPTYNKIKQPFVNETISKFNEEIRIVDIENEDWISTAQLKQKTKQPFKLPLGWNPKNQLFD